MEELSERTFRQICREPTKFLEKPMFESLLRPRSFLFLEILACSLEPKDREIMVELLKQYETALTLWDEIRERGNRSRVRYTKSQFRMPLIQVVIQSVPRKKVTDLQFSRYFKDAMHSG